MSHINRMLRRKGAIAGLLAIPAMAIVAVAAPSANTLAPQAISISGPGVVDDLYGTGMGLVDGTNASASDVVDAVSSGANTVVGNVDNATAGLVDGALDAAGVSLAV